MKPTRIKLILGDQLDAGSSILQDVGPEDVILMAEVPHESLHVPTHRKRTALFFAAMRHFAAELQERGHRVEYLKIVDHSHITFEDAVGEKLRSHRAVTLEVVRPGAFRVVEALRGTAKKEGAKFVMLEDQHFLATPTEFSEFRVGRKRLAQEDFYRHMRKKYQILLDPDGKPEGGKWNFDKENRQAMSDEELREVPPRCDFPPDPLTREVIAEVEQHFPDNPGCAHGFAMPVSRNDALVALEDFIAYRLDRFGDYQDAIRKGNPDLYHSHLSTCLNLKLLNPLEVIEAVENAYREGKVRINSAEGFIRQVLGWREFIRGVYWTEMPSYLEKNALDHRHPLPDFFWTGDTEMACIADTVQSVRDGAYAHHIQRLMVTGLYAMLLGVRPQEVHAWYLGMFADAVEWVELPNTLGMSQYADGGIVGTKPYAASGKYIDRMSDCCQGCRFDPNRTEGADACPFTVLYWDFLDRHRERFAWHPRMALQVRNVQRKDVAVLEQIRKNAIKIKRETLTLSLSSPATHREQADAS